MICWLSNGERPLRGGGVNITNRLLLGEGGGFDCEIKIWQGGGGRRRNDGFTKKIAQPPPPPPPQLINNDLPLIISNVTAENWKLDTQKKSHVSEKQIYLVPRCLPEYWQVAQLHIKFQPSSL